MKKTDVVCGMEVDENGPHQTQYGDRTYHFCSAKCENDFVGNPLRYVDKSRSVGSTEGSPKILPSGREVQSRS
ncbi:MAG: YHS domain-containing protein [Elusimicrobia bacterium]|nr:YHS domain-containing protein [Elusimicrobiota bacterium]